MPTECENFSQFKKAHLDFLGGNQSSLDIMKLSQSKDYCFSKDCDLINVCIQKVLQEHSLLKTI